MATMVEEINQIVQNRLAQSQIRGRSVHLRSRADLGVEIVVDGKVYQDLSEIDDIAVHDLIQASVDEWRAEQAPTPSAQTESLETDVKTPISSTKTRLTKKQHRLALLVTGLPLGLGLVLFVINPAYIGAMFSELCGWMMLAVIFICVGIAYITLRVSFVLSNRLEPPGWFMQRYTLRLIFVGCVIALFVVPAVLLISFGPYVLIIMRSGIIGTI